MSSLARWWHLTGRCCVGPGRGPQAGRLDGAVNILQTVDHELSALVNGPLSHESNYNANTHPGRAQNSVLDSR
ncbi:hypothetical protein ACIP4T_09695 [Streptomyces massasporeus]|uniref:hypothetical protein n=1 Tax=Streptomyces massasporeus TaxID=67324 RepID=UPI0036CB6087